jgi:hypothetical protein
VISRPCTAVRFLMSPPAATAAPWCVRKTAVALYPPWSEGLRGTLVSPQSTVIESSFALRYTWESTGSYATRPTGAGTDSTVVPGVHSPK